MEYETPRIQRREGEKAALTRLSLALVVARFFFTSLVISCGGGGDNNGAPGIGPAGGVVTSADGNASVIIPPGALSQARAITVMATATAPAGNIGTAYEFGPGGTTFIQPASISIRYVEEDLTPGVNEADLRLAKVINDTWQPIANSVVDASENLVAGMTSSFSVYGVIAVQPQAQPLRAPADVTAVDGDSQVTLSWAAVPDATSYSVYMASESGVTPGNVGSLQGGMTHTGVSSPFIHTELTNGNTYYFVVTAVNIAGESGPSAEVSATPSGPDTTSPTVRTTYPADRATFVPLNSVIIANFSEVMDFFSLRSSMIVTERGFPISGRLDIEGTIVRFIPQMVLLPDTVYTVTIGTGATDVAGNPLYSPYAWVFSTGASLPPPAPILTVNAGIKQLEFSWSDAPTADFYQLFEDPDGVSGFSQVGGDLPAVTTTATLDITVYRHDWARARFRVTACNSQGCTHSNEVTTIGQMLQAIGYVKASNTGVYDFFGLSVALSADGNTLAVGSYGEDSAASGINGDQENNSAFDAGAVYVFSHSDGIWTQQAYIKASNPDAEDNFGGAVALSADGNTLVVGALGEDSSATGINGDQEDDSARWAGAVYVFTRSEGVWGQQAYVKASNTEGSDVFGASVALSADGNILAVGAIGEDSAARGINGAQEDNSSFESGAVYVFSRSGEVWNQQAYVKASNTEPGFGPPRDGDQFGVSVSLNAAGDTLAVGAHSEQSNATGINGDQENESAPFAGAVYLFTRSGEVWNQQAYVKASNTQAGDRFGHSVALSADGNTLAAGAFGEDSAATWINGNHGDNSAVGSGAVYVFTRSGEVWNQQAYVKASNTESGDGFGGSVALSADGNVLAVGAGAGEDSAARGINGNQEDNSSIDSGAVYVFTRSGEVWNQQAYVKASNTEVLDLFGTSVTLSTDGSTLATGAIHESSNAIGLNGNQEDNSSLLAGAVYLY